MTINFITEQELRDSAPDIDLSQYTSTTISGMINRSTSRAENYLGYTLPFESMVNEKSEAYVDSDGDLIILPKKTPIRLVTGVVITKGGVSATLTLTQNGRTYYDIPEPLTQIVIPTSQISLNTVTLVDFWSLRGMKFFVNLSYDAGFYMYDRPADIMDAIILYCRDELGRKFTNSGATELSQGAVSMKFGGRGGVSKTKNQTDAELILNRYKRMTFF